MPGRSQMIGRGSNKTLGRDSSSILISLLKRAPSKNRPWNYMKQTLANWNKCVYSPEAVQISYLAVSSNLWRCINITIKIHHFKFKAHCINWHTELASIILHNSSEKRLREEKSRNPINFGSSIADPGVKKLESATSNLKIRFKKENAFVLILWTPQIKLLSTTLIVLFQLLFFCTQLLNLPLKQVSNVAS